MVFVDVLPGQLIKPAQLVIMGVPRPTVVASGEGHNFTIKHFNNSI